MRQRLYHRLRQLEEANAARARKLRDQRREEDGARAREKVAIFLRARRIEPEPHESVMDALARALEITPRELHELLAAGIDPMHKYFTEHGIFEEIERRKAAGTWPGG